jgi:hypothetical protein
MRVMNYAEIKSPRAFCEAESFFSPQRSCLAGDFDEAHTLCRTETRNEN